MTLYGWGCGRGMGHRDGEQSSANAQEEERKDPGKNGGVGQAWRVQALTLSMRHNLWQKFPKNN